MLVFFFFLPEKKFLELNFIAGTGLNQGERRNRWWSRGGQRVKNEQKDKLTVGREYSSRVILGLKKLIPPFS